MRARRLVAAALVTVALGLALAWLSQAPTTYARPGHALVRLSWRVDGVRIESCRPRTEEELRALAPHMRTPEVCTGTGADFELRVALDEDPILVDTLTAGGARGDRPIYLYHDLAVEPGPHGLDVSFAPLLPDSVAAVNGIRSYRFVDQVQVAEHEVALVTLDSTAARLVRLTP